MPCLPILAVLAVAQAGEPRINFEVTGLVVNAARPGGAAWEVFPTDALLAAARKGGVVWAPVADQTQGTVLFAGVTAWVVPGSRAAGAPGR
jgi:hypothetical protein